MMPVVSHTPVLVSPTLDLLQPERGGVFLDATIGLGGHTAAILERAAKAGVACRVIGLDQDAEALTGAQERLAPYADQVQLYHGNFGDTETWIHEHAWPLFDGALFDIGVSSLQLDLPQRGFSFRQDGPLDMRMNQEIATDAATIVNTWPETVLVRILKTHGEEPFAGRIARALVERRRTQPFTSTTELAEVVAQCYPPKLRHGRIHPATRTFQALRIEVNNELEMLVTGLQALLPQMKPGGRIAVITFHSLEDRIVKHLFRQWQHEGLGEIMTKKPISATEEEMRVNPRSRSAKLRGFQKVA